MALVESEKLPVGWEAIEFHLTGTDEKAYSLESFEGKKGLLVVFTCNHCPYARAAWPTLVQLHHRYGNDIGFIAVNPNDEKKYPDDSFEAMKKKMREWEIPFPYVRDDSQDIARAYSAQCTPDPYLFKNHEGTFKLFYHGRIADNWEKPALAREKNLEDAIAKLLKGSHPPKAQPSSMGCSIKWQDVEEEE